MGIVEICIAFKVAIIGIAYPIILQVISDMDNRYSSRLITGLFRSERVEKYFLIAVYISLCSVFLYLIWSVIEYFTSINIWFMYAIATVILLSTVYLVLSFLFYTDKAINTYYNKESLTNYLIRMDEELDKTN